jgi:hypothetical protein
MTADLSQRSESTAGSEVCAVQVAAAPLPRSSGRPLTLGFGCKTGAWACVCVCVCGGGGHTTWGGGPHKRTEGHPRVPLCGGLKAPLLGRYGFRG